MVTRAILVVDAGTSSNKGVLVGPDGEILRALDDVRHHLDRDLNPASPDVVHAPARHRRPEGAAS